MRLPTDKEEYDKFITKHVAESRAAQGLPPKITDPKIIARVVAILTARPKDPK